MLTRYASFDGARRPLLAPRQPRADRTCGNRVPISRRGWHRGVCAAFIVTGAVVLLTSAW